MRFLLKLPHSQQIQSGAAYFVRYAMGGKRIMLATAAVCLKRIGTENKDSPSTYRKRNVFLWNFVNRRSSLNPYTIFEPRFSDNLLNIVI